MGEQVKGLEHHAHALTNGAQIGLAQPHILAEHGDLARSGRLQAVDAAHQGGLARTRGADNGDDLAPVNDGIHVLQRRGIGVHLLQMLYLNEFLIAGGGLDASLRLTLWIGARLFGVHALGQAAGTALGVDIDLQPAYSEDNQAGNGEVDGGSSQQGEEGIEGTAADDIPRLGQVLDGDIAHDGGELDHGHQFALVQGQHMAQRLGHDYPAKGTRPAEAQRRGRLPLAVVHRVDAAVEHAGHRHREHDAKGDDAHRHRA